MTGFCDGGDEPSRSVRGSPLNISVTLVCRMEIWDLIDYLMINDIMDRSQWPRGLRRGSAAVRLLRLWVRIPPGAWKLVCCKCCVLLGRGLWDELIAHPEDSYRMRCVALCDVETSRMRRPWAAMGCSTSEGKNMTSCSLVYKYWRFGRFIAPILRMKETLEMEVITPLETSVLVHVPTQLHMPRDICFHGSPVRTLRLQIFKVFSDSATNLLVV